VEAEKLLSLESVQVVTITVTESGYHFKGDWSLDLQSQEISTELSGGRVQSVYAFLARGLEKRMRLLSSTSESCRLSILCCDNIRSNGHRLAAAFFKYLEQSTGIIGATTPAQLSKWVYRYVSFPCSMVDRITPRPTLALLAEIQTQFPNLPQSGSMLTVVHAEDFVQWVLEEPQDCPDQKRRMKGILPMLNKVGVQLVPDITPYEEAKIRILNGGHTALAYMSVLAGYKTVQQALQDEDIISHLQEYITQEVLPSLISEHGELPFNVELYWQKICRRFQNMGMEDQLSRICMDGYSKMAIYIRPTLTACLRSNIHPVRCLTCIASWILYLRHFELQHVHHKDFKHETQQQHQQQGEPLQYVHTKEFQVEIEYIDPFWTERFRHLIQVGNEHLLLHETPIWGDLPKEFPQLKPTFLNALEKINRRWPVPHVS